MNWLTQMRMQEHRFLDQARDEEWLTEPQLVVIVREMGAWVRGDAYVFDPTTSARRLEFDGRELVPAEHRDRITPLERAYR